MVKHVIDCDADPFLPQGWEVEEHRKGGQVEYDPSKITLHLSKNQRDGKVMGGNELREELRTMPVMNANVLDWYLAHPELIPPDWKGKLVCFWGTIYRSSGGGGLYVFYLSWDGDRWRWSYIWLGHGFGDRNPAVLSQENVLEPSTIVEAQN
ncbi:MAG TPA: hypothetical protein VJH94_04770 [Candidatus Paceibacterota bacterium]